MNPGRHGACLVPDRIHTSRLYVLFGRGYFIDTNRNTNRHIGIGSISWRGTLCVTLSGRRKQKYLEIWR